MPLYFSPSYQTTYSGADYGYIAMAWDPAVGSGTATALTPAGTVWVVRVPVPYQCIVTNVILYMAGAGSSLTANQCGAALYQNNALLSATAMTQSTTWNSTGLKTMALTTPQTVTPGVADVAFFYNGTTGPAPLKANAATVGNLGGAIRSVTTSDTGKTTTFPSTLGTKTGNASLYWAAIS